MTIKIGSIITNSLKIERPLSEKGGMASVYLASFVTDPRMKVAVKFARSSTNGPEHEDVLLQREADLLSRWDWRHPGVVRIFPIPFRDRKTVYFLKAIELPETPYFFIMEYLSGGSLTDNLTKIKGYSFNWKLELFYQLFTTVAHLHQLGFGHRDPKPDTIVFREPISPTSIPQPVLIDFALASNGQEGSQIVDSSHTLEYASPERVLKTLGMGYEKLPSYPLESDIWSLGVIMYEVITGDLLFKGSEKKIKTSIIEGAFKVELSTGALIQGKAELAHLFAGIIRKTLDGDALKRPTAKMLIYAIEELFQPPRIPVG